MTPKGRASAMSQHAGDASRAAVATGAGAFGIVPANDLSSMRRRRSGHIIYITSMGGIVTFPGLGIYHGSKFALEGITDALGKEVAGFGIKVIAVELGGFRTDWARRSMRRGDQHIADDEALFAPLRQARTGRSGKQVGDSAKAAAAIHAIVGESNPPAHFFHRRVEFRDYTRSTPYKRKSALDTRDNQYQRYPLGSLGGSRRAAPHPERLQTLTAT
jgi:NAD(P)-dependent dehydrogenase (short-subunit alcohol dehydrogenase family)